MNKQIETLVRHQLALADRVAGLEDQLASAKALYRVVRDSDLPEAMRSAELTTYTTQDGNVVTLSDDCHVNVTAEGMDQFVEWAEQHGLGAMVKHRLTMEFGRGEGAIAQAFRKMVEVMLPHLDIEVIAPERDSETLTINAIKALANNTFPSHEIVHKKTVHHSTLKAFVQKQLKKGNPLPECLGVYAPESAVITRPTAAPVPIHSLPQEDPYAAPVGR